MYLLFWIPGKCTSYFPCPVLVFNRLPGVCLDNLQTVPMDESIFDAAYSAAGSYGEVISLESPSPKRPEGLKDGVE